MTKRERVTAQKAAVGLSRNSERRRFARQLRVYEIPLLLWLMVLWMMLWQEISLLTIVSGFIVAFGVTRLFFLPPVELSGRFNPLAALKYLLFFLYELMLGSLQVSWLALNPAKQVQPAVIAVQLRTRSDFILTMTGLTISLIPGSLIADIDRFNSVLYLHALHAPDERTQQKLRRDVLLIEKLLISAIGSREEMEACNVND